MRNPYAKTDSERNKFCFFPIDCTWACFSLVCLAFCIALMNNFWQRKVKAGVADIKAICVSQRFCLVEFSVPLAVPQTLSPTRRSPFQAFPKQPYFCQPWKARLSLHPLQGTVQVQGSSCCWSPRTQMPGFLYKLHQKRWHYGAR